MIIAGLDCAGKTAFARELLPNAAGGPTFVSADLIAGGRNPLQLEPAEIAAGRMLLDPIAGTSTEAQLRLCNHPQRGNQY